MQTILGTGGAIGTELAKALKNYTSEIRLVSRHPKKVNGDDMLLSADLMNEADVDLAVKGSEVAYLTAGLKYNTKVWEEKWPAIMENVIKACKKYNCKLVFFDNVYMYDKEAIPSMTEESPINPPSKKGEVRKQIAKMLLEQMMQGKITALIARSADFYGPNVQNSVLQETVFKNYLKGKSALLIASSSKTHTYTYTPDAAKATALLGNTPDTYNQVWHLPTARPGLTGKEWAELFAKEMGVKPKYTVIPIFAVKAIGVFNNLMKEISEMLYQNNRDYEFDSSKFEKRFNFKPTSYEKGVKEVVKNSNS